MHTKKILTLTILAFLLANSAIAQSNSRLHKILKSGELRVGTTGDWNPMTVRDPASNSYKGFDIDVVKELAKDMGVKLKFVPTEWKTLINGIVADKYDISTSASVTPQAVTLGTSQEQQAKKIFPNANIHSVEAPARDFHEVLSGRAQISVTSNLEASMLIQAHSQLAVVPVSEPRTPADLAFILAQGDQVWLNFLNHWITIKQNRGFFERLKAKWMPTN